MPNMRMTKAIMSCTPQDEWINGNHLSMLVMRQMLDCQLPEIQKGIRELAKLGSIQYRVQKDENNKQYSEFRR